MKKKSIRWNYQMVYKFFEEKGCQLLATEYVNSRTKMDYICECGSKSSIVFSAFKKGVRCMDCGKRKTANKNLTPYEEVKEYYNSQDCILLSIEYTNANKKLDFICSCGEKHSSKFSNFKNGQRCPKCSLAKRTSKRRLEIEEVRKRFLDNNLTPMFKDDEYTNSNTPLPYVCNAHKDEGIQYRAVGTLGSSDGCFICSRERAIQKQRHDINNVYNYFYERGLLLEENQEYLRKNQLLNYRCIKHSENLQKITLNNLHLTIEPCDYCRKEKRIGEVNKVLRNQLSNWKSASEKECDYQCIFTGSKEYEIHHIKSFSTIVKEIIEENNIELKDFYSSEEWDIMITQSKIKHSENLGVCLRKDIHELFHTEYGRINNNKSQLDEFLENLSKGTYDIRLK